MKISSVGSNDAILNCNKIQKSASVKGSLETKISDSLELSEGAQKYSALLKEAKESLAAADANEKIKMENILSKIKDGSYQVSEDEVVHDILSGFPTKQL